VLTQEKIAINIIVCKMLQDLLEKILCERLVEQITFMAYKKNSSGNR